MSEWFQAELFEKVVPDTVAKAPVDRDLTSEVKGVSVVTPGGHEARDGEHQN